MTPDTGSVRCCIVGGGPAGMMLGLLLARAGVSVLVLEKHGDFLRDFRGDTIHPSTLDVVHELEARREWPTRVTQRIQVAVQNRVITAVLAGRAPVRPPLVVRLLARFPVLRRIPARLVGIGIRPEHVTTPVVRAV